MGMNGGFAGAHRLVNHSQRIAVIGGGASGVLMALHLLRQTMPLHVVLIEKSDLLGCGVAYGTREPGHLLNTRAANMSAFADQPAHFVDWLRTHVDPATCPFSFVSRRIYGRYLAETLAVAAGSGRMTCLRDEATRLTPSGAGYRIALASGDVIHADVAILATGHALPAGTPADAVNQPWATEAPLAPDADVLLIGTGLTMVDQALKLLRAGHRGRIEAISRRGLLPRAHADAAPITLVTANLPLGWPVSQLLRWLRGRVSDAALQGGDWRGVVDGLRPHVRTIWQAMSLAERARFLRHACTWWEVHRHRVPPESAAALDRALNEGRLTLRRAAFVGAERVSDEHVLVRLRAVPGGPEEHHTFQAVIDCRGIRRDLLQHAAPIIRHLLADGLATLDPLRLGIGVDHEGRPLRPDGTAHHGIHTIGPVSRAALWEITAIPDIRMQAAEVARTLATLGRRSHSSLDQAPEKNAEPGFSG